MLLTKIDFDGVLSYECELVSVKHGISFFF